MEGVGLFVAVGLVLVLLFSPEIATSFHRWRRRQARRRNRQGFD